jgi:hypothetical protein
VGRSNRLARRYGAAHPRRKNTRHDSKPCMCSCCGSAAAKLRNRRAAHSPAPAIAARMMRLPPAEPTVRPASFMKGTLTVSRVRISDALLDCRINGKAPWLRSKGNRSGRVQGKIGEARCFALHQGTPPRYRLPRFLPAPLMRTAGRCPQGETIRSDELGFVGDHLLRHRDLGCHSWPGGRSARSPAT